MTTGIMKLFHDELVPVLTPWIGTRLNPLILRPDSEVPAATYWLLNSAPNIILSGRIAEYQTRFQVDGIARDLSTVLEIQKAVIDHFLGLTLVGPPSVSRAANDVATYYYEHDLQMYRSITGISIYSEGI